MKFSISAFVTSLLLALIIGYARKYPSEGVLNWDVTGYYFYLPATFIHHDLALTDAQWMEEMRVKYDLSGTLYQFHPVPDRNTRVDQYTMGMAMMYAPAFAAGHVAAKITGAEQDGFSDPYRKAVYIWSMVVTAVGLILLRKLLLSFFSDHISALIIVMIVAGTNYFITISHGLATPHNYLFTLYVLFLLASLRWIKKQDIKSTLLMALPFGLMCLARPTEMIAIAFPLMWGCDSFEKIKARFSSLFTSQKHLLITFLITVLCIGIPQLLYWHLVSGQLIYMSYANPGEGFDFLTPHTLDFLFSYRKGWLIYTPLVVLGFVALPIVYRKHKAYFYPFVLFMLINLYIVSSWSCWWYAQCFSQRAMVHTLPIMALLMGFFLLWLNENRTRKFVGAVIISGMFALTVFYQWQFEHGIINQDRMTKAYFWKVFGKTRVSSEERDLLLIERSFSGPTRFTQRDRYTQTHSWSYRQELPGDFDTTYAPAGIDSLRYLSTAYPFSQALRKKYHELTASDHAWIVIDAEVFLTDTAQRNDLYMVCLVEHKGKTYSYMTETILPDSNGLILPGMQTIHLEFLTPEVRKKNDVLSTYLWYAGAGEVFAKDFKVQVYERKP